MPKFHYSLIINLNTHFKSNLYSRFKKGSEQNRVLTYFHILCNNSYITTDFAQLVTSFKICSQINCIKSKCNVFAKRDKDLSETWNANILETRDLDTCPKGTHLQITAIPFHHFQEKDQKNTPLGSK